MVIYIEGLKKHGERGEKGLILVSVVFLLVVIVTMPAQALMF
jgi:hypothetical protein